jgi:flagellar motor switch protein FliM
LRVLRQATLTVEALMEGPTLSVGDLLGLREGNLLTFDFPVDRPIELVVNGARKFTGQVVSTGRKRACQIGTVRPLPYQGKMSEDAGATSGSGPPE